MSKFAVKYTTQGFLIYGVMAAYLLAALTLLVGRTTRSTGVRVAGWVVYLIGFVLAVAAFAYRWQHVQRVPLSNMFEVFLCLGMLVFLISLFSRFVLRVGLEFADALLGVIILFPAGFIFDAEPNRHLMPALQSWLFTPHIAAYMFAYVVLAKAAFQAIAALLHLDPNPVMAGGEAPVAGIPPQQKSITRPSATPRADVLVPYEDATYRIICFGFPLLTIGLILGSWWGKLAWGDVWGWDPKELWSLVCWLVYTFYLHFRYMYGKKHKRINSWVAIAGLAAIVITLLWVNLASVFKGLHSYASS